MSDSRLRRLHVGNHENADPSDITAAMSSAGNRTAYLHELACCFACNVLDLALPDLQPRTVLRNAKRVSHKLSMDE